MPIESWQIPIVGAAMHYLGMGQSVERVTTALMQRPDFGPLDLPTVRGLVSLALAQLKTTELAAGPNAGKPLGESQLNVVPTDQMVSVRVVVEYTDTMGQRVTTSLIIDAPQGATPNEVTDYALNIWQVPRNAASPPPPPGQDAAPIAFIVAVYSYQLGSGIRLGS